MLYPIFWMFFSSFKPNEEIFETAQILIPNKWTIENYISGWKGFGGVSFDVFFKNSFLYSGLGTIRGIPIELDEAAKIDGCSKYGIFFRIILPLVTPAIITTTIFSFYWKWDDFLGPLLYLSKPKLYTMSLALKVFNDSTTTTNWGGLLAMSILSIVPALVLFFVFQDYLVEGIATTGIKG